MINERQLRDLLICYETQAAASRRHARAAKCEETSLVEDGMAAAYVDAASMLKGLLDGMESVPAYRQSRVGGPGRSIEEVRAEQIAVRHLSEKDPHAQGAA